MLAKQISIFLENKLGRLAEATKILSEAKINIRSLVISDTTDFGILRLIVNDTEKAYRVLKENNFTVRITEVIVLNISDEVGGLSTVLEILDEAGLEIEYMYAFLGRKAGEAPVVFRFEEVDKAMTVLKEHSITVLTEKEV